MRIKYIDGGFIEIIENGIVEKVICDYDGVCTVYFYDKPPKELNVGCSSYNRQFGMPVSDDGCKLFVSSWEKGLFAYDIMSGSVLWQLKDKKITSIVVHPTYVVTRKDETSIIKLDIESGKVLAEIKSGTIVSQFDLGGSYILVNSIKGKLSVVDTEKMLIIKKYSPKVVNPSNCLSMLIQNAVLKGNVLIVSGVEDYPNKEYGVSAPRPFERVIDADFDI